MTQQGKFILLGIDEFGAWLGRTAVQRTIRLIQNHHTWIPSYQHFNGENHFARLEAMETAHRERGFDEIAQNLTTFPDGTVAVCRSLDKNPAGIKGANARGICIEHLGDFDSGRDVMTDPHRTCVLRVNALVCRKFGFAPGTDTIVYHHWYDLQTGERLNGAGSTKTCPGTAFFGGNSVAAAQAGFIPLIQQQLAALG